MVYEGINKVAQWGIAVLLGVVAVSAGLQISSGNADEQAEASAFIPPAELMNVSIGAGITTTLPPTSTNTLPGSTTTTQIETTSTSTPEPSSTTSVTTASTTTTMAKDPSTTTTIPPRPTTTTTTTSISPITTTIPPRPTTTTTTTSIPPPSTTTATTTTPTIATEVALFVDGFSGKASGGGNGWEVELVISLGATLDGSERASVAITWSGSTIGQRVVTTGGSGTALIAVGPFTGASVTFAIINVTPLSSEWEYKPELNTVSTAVTVIAPAEG